MSAQIEEGELPEEGEIMEEEDEEPVPTMRSENTTASTTPTTPNSSVSLSSSKNIPKDNSILPSKKNFVLVPGGNATSSSIKIPKYRDYDGKSARNVESTQELVMSSWMSGLQRRNRQTTASASGQNSGESPSTTSTPFTSSTKTNIRSDEVISSDSKFDAVSSTVPIIASATKDKVVKAETMDRDFRRLSSAEGEIFDDEEEEDGEEKCDPIRILVKNESFDAYGEDNDYRQQSNDKFGGDRRRRNSDGHSDDLAPLSKRAKATDTFDISSTQQTLGGNGDVGENSPTSSTPPFGDGGSGNFATPNNYRGGNYHHNGRTPLGFMNASGGMMSRVAPPRWASHTICKFFREGYCRDGDNCAFSHNAVDSNRRPELCKFYNQGYCKRGMMCLHMHGEYPCKAFHKGECENEECQYSHQPLDDFTRPIFDQIMQDEELTSHISIPTHPLRRKVLIPQGPETSESNEQQNAPPSGPLTSALRTPQPPHRVIEEKSMAATGTYGFFNPITPSSTTHSTPTPTPASFSTGSSGTPGYSHGGSGGTGIGHSHGQDNGLVMPQHLSSGYGHPLDAPQTLGAYAQGPSSHPAGTLPSGGILTLPSHPTPSLGAFSTPSLFHAPTRPQQTVAGSQHGFYNPPNRAANLPPPTLLTAPPPLASNPKAATPQHAVTSSFSSSPSPSLAMTATTSTFLSSSSLFNSPSTSGSTGKATSTLTHQQTPSGLFSGALFTSSSLSSSVGFSTPFTAKSSDESRKPLGIFSGGFFENSASSSIETGYNKSNSGAGFHNIGMDMGGMGLGGSGSEGFNISAMLEKITQQAPSTSQALTTLLNSANGTGDNAFVGSTEDESPASPPSLFTDSVDASKMKLIPIICEWKLFKVDVDPPADITFDLKLIGISSGTYRNDPRLKKLAEKQFDLVTKTLEKQSNAVAGGGLIVKQEPMEFKPPNFFVAGSSTPNSNNLAAAAKPLDPRMKLADPRKKAALPSNASTASSTSSFSIADGIGIKQEIGYGLKPESGGFFVPNFEDVKQSKITTSPPVFGGVTANSNVGASQLSSTSQKLPDDIFQSMVQQQLKMVNQMQHGQGVGAAVASGSDDVDHRASFPPPPIIAGQKSGKAQAGPSPPHNLSGGTLCGGPPYYYGGKGAAGVSWNSPAPGAINSLPAIGADPRAGIADANISSSFGNAAGFSNAGLDDLNSGAGVSSTSNFEGGFCASGDVFDGESRFSLRDSRFVGRGGGFYNGRGGGSLRYGNINNNSTSNGYDENNRGNTSTQRWDNHVDGNSSPDESIGGSGIDTGGRFGGSSTILKNAAQRTFFQNKIDRIDHHQNNNSHEGGSLSLETNRASPSVSPGAVTTQPVAPLSLREKRKNNEYESPLARMSSKY